MIWYDVCDLTLEGRGWSDTETWSDRLPLRAKDAVGPAVWSLSHHTAGLCVRFGTDSGSIGVRWDLRSDQLAMPHMPATGVSGVDLYTREDGRWRWIGASKSVDAQKLQRVILEAKPTPREFLLYLPLYNGVTSMEIGIDVSSKLLDVPPMTQKPLVVYGTSIVQGACASRPGMAYPAILGRWLERPTINLGFSGSGPMQPEMAPFLAELDPAMFIIDSLPNMNPEQVRERCEPFVRTLRAKHPATPIVLVENIVYQNTFAADPDQTTRHGRKNYELRLAFDRMRRRDPNLHYVPSRDLLGDDWEAAVDGTHLTDLGFHRFATAIAPRLRQILAD